MDTFPHSERLRVALLQNLARVLANQAVDVLEPLSGHAIDDEARTALASDIAHALTKNAPPLVHVVHALDVG